MVTSTNSTRLLVEGRRGHKEALDALMPQVLTELREIAHRLLQRRPAGGVLDTTGLVHEAYLKLVAHFLFPSRARDGRDESPFPFPRPLVSVGTHSWDRLGPKSRYVAGARAEEPALPHVLQPGVISSFKYHRYE